MRTGISITLTPLVRGRLEAITRDRNAAQKHAWRAAIVLLSADGVGTNEIMRRTGKSKTCVWRWQERFMQEGIEGLLRDKTRPSRIAPLGPRGGRACGDADACRSARRDDPLDRRPDGTSERHQRQRGPAHLEERMDCSRTVIGSSSSRTTRTSSTSCATWSGSTSIRRPTPSCCRSTRRARSRLSTAPSRACR